MRETLSPEKISAPALKSIKSFHEDVVSEVKEAIQKNRVVVVGMAQNPVVKKARKLLSEKNLEHKYLEYGSYLGAWRKRLAIKLWSGWPTFPQVFIDGRLIGGHADLVEHFKNSKN